MHLIELKIKKSRFKNFYYKFGNVSIKDTLTTLNDLLDESICKSKKEGDSHDENAIALQFSIDLIKRIYK